MGIRARLCSVLLTKLFIASSRFRYRGQPSLSKPLTVASHLEVRVYMSMFNVDRCLFPTVLFIDTLCSDLPFRPCPLPLCCQRTPSCCGGCSSDRSHFQLGHQINSDLPASLFISCVFQVHRVGLQTGIGWEWQLGDLGLVAYCSECLQHQHYKHYLQWQGTWWCVTKILLLLPLVRGVLSGKQMTGTLDISDCLFGWPSSF